MSDNTAAANKRLVGRFYKEVYGDWNMAMVDEVVSPRFTSHDWPAGTPTGAEGFGAFYSAIRTALPDARYEVDDLIAEGDKVVVRWRLLGHTWATLAVSLPPAPRSRSRGSRSTGWRAAS